MDNLHLAMILAASGHSHSPPSNAGAFGPIPGPSYLSTLQVTQQVWVRGLAKAFPPLREKSW